VPKVDYITPSALNSFNFCSAKWDFDRQENIPTLPVDDEHMEFGLMVHSAISDYYSKIPEKPRPVEIDTRAKQSFADFVDVRTASLKSRYQICLSNFIRFEIGRLETFRRFKPDFVEHAIQSGFIRGKVDAFWKEDSTLVDWKTGSFNDGNISEDFMRQGSLYRRMLNESGTQCSRVIFVMLLTGRIIEIPRVPDAWIDNEINKMLNGQIVPNRGIWCKNCPYQLRCEFSLSDRPQGLWDL
jgi:hypothetical protein